MIVDCHTHIRFTAQDNLDLSEHIEAAQVVDKCIVLAGCDGPPAQVNARLSGYVAKYPNKMVGFAVFNPLSDAASPRNLKALTEKLMLKGLVLYCSHFHFHPAHTLAMMAYEAAQQLKIPVFFHNSPQDPDANLEFAQPLILDEVARTFPDLKIIIGNMGNPFVEQTICLLSKHQNVFADLSVNPGNLWQVYNTVIAASEQAVLDKLLFGSAFPDARPQQCIETLLGFNKIIAGDFLPKVPRENIQEIIERDSLKLLGIET
ncbi:MAG: amidohydrolase family protein [Sedimentisphaerales bacterium]|nr:amidohydrolase family protein [Sedimentisphaerales bacterium]